MWPFLALALALTGAVALHCWWWRRYRRLRGELCAQRQSCASFQQEQDQVLAAHQAQLQALFNSMAEGVLVLDANGRIQLVNQSLQRLFALTSDVRGQTILEAFRIQELADLVKRLPREKAVHRFEFELPGMEERWLQVNAAAVFNRDGAPHGGILVFHDLTRLKQLENTRQEFVANVSHELRTPLSLIKGFVETLLGGAKNDPELATRFLRTIERHTDRLTYLIEDLLTISRLESGQIVMNLQPVELRDEAQRVVEALQARAAEKGALLDNQVPAGLMARADADRLEQVFFNLVENAIKYGHPGSRVCLGARNAEPGRVELWVQDNGPGIPSDSTDRIFERFYRVDRARSRESGGTGLGLAIVKHIVQAHSGEVWVKSELGQGATFYFTLPQA